MKGELIALVDGEIGEAEGRHDARHRYNRYPCG